MKISVLIPTYNAGNEIVTLLNLLNSQVLDEGQETEVIIVDSTSTDNTVELIRENFPNISLYIIENKKFDHGGTRNYLASLANGEYLLFMTQDALPVDNFLIKNLLQPLLQNRDVYISYARQIPKDNAGILEQYARSFNYPARSIIKSKESLPKLGIKTFFNSNVCSMYNKEAFIKYNGFPERIILNEDMILSSKIILDGYKVSYSADAKVFHSHNYSLIQQFKRYFDIGMAFEETSYLLKYASNEREGFRMVRNQIIFLLKNGKPYLIFYSIIENIMKFLGYKLGKKHNLLPITIKRKLSAYMK